MNKFEKWNKLKIKLNNLNRNINFHEKEIWYISLWENIWFEQNWKGDNFLRPVLVFKKFNKQLFYWIPLTSKKKEWKFYYKFEFKKWIISNAILSQMRLYDSKRLFRRYWMISKHFYQELSLKIKKLLF